jgi:hypothetical protein
MGFDPVSAALDIGGKLIDRLWPDPTQAAQAKVALLQMQQTGELAKLTADTDLAKAQAAVNQVEAGSNNLFISGWRPMVGWLCAAGVGVQFVVGPVGSWIADLFGYAVTFPAMDTGTLLALLVGMLGIGGMRTYEKVTGTSANEPGH